VNSYADTNQYQIPPDKFPGFRKLLASRGISFEDSGAISGKANGNWSYDGSQLRVEIVKPEMEVAQKLLMLAIQYAVNDCFGRVRSIR
jgi:hypothetical protein